MWLTSTEVTLVELLDLSWLFVELVSIVLLSFVSPSSIIITLLSCTSFTVLKGFSEEVGVVSELAWLPEEAWLVPEVDTLGFDLFF